MGGTRSRCPPAVGVDAGRAPRFPDATSYFAAPDHANAASLRILDKAGFTQGTWFDEPQRDGTTATVVGCTLDVRRVLARQRPRRAP